MAGCHNRHIQRRFSRFVGFNCVKHLDLATSKYSDLITHCLRPEECEWKAGSIFRGHGRAFGFGLTSNPVDQDQDPWLVHQGSTVVGHAQAPARILVFAACLSNSLLQDGTSLRRCHRNLLSHVLGATLQSLEGQTGSP